MESNYQQYYKTLNLDPDADWETALQTYRSLVLRWHPDRQTSGDYDSQLVQERFIELTRSFHAIRRFQRKYHRMPLLPIARQRDTQRFSPTDSPLNQARRRELSGQRKLREKLKPAIYLILGVAFCVAVLWFLFMLDRQLIAEADQKAKAGLQNSAPSQFEKTLSEVSRAEAKGAFINYDPAGGALSQDSGKLFEQK